ncbi:T9SS type A sorting domain-containing protein [Candidatus Zixiibacteriota bacterium]
MINRERVIGRDRRPRLFALLPVIALICSTLFLITRSPEHTPPPDATAFSDAMASMHFLHDQRVYPDNEIPQAMYQEAYEKVEPRIRLARLGRGAGRDYAEPSPWQQIGPKNVGGRTIALAINPLDPRILYAGAASGGIWRSNNSGYGVDAWHYLETGFPVLGVNAIAIDPADTARVYIGTGEVYGKYSSIGGLNIRTTRGSYGIGILRTSDGGATWEKCLDWSYEQQRGVLSLKIDPNDSSRLFAGTSEGLYRSTDRGDTWDLVLDEDMVVDLAINHINSDTLFASCGNLGIPSDSGIWRSLDGGDTWTQLGSALPDNWTGKTLLDIYQAAPNVIYADVANALSDEDPAGVGLYRSLDSGDTWEELTSGYSGYNQIPRYQGWFSHFVCVHPQDSSRVVVAGVNSYLSTDGGRTFTQKSHTDWYWGATPVGGQEGDSNYSHADNHCFVRHPTQPNTIFFGTDGGIYRSTDFGQTFTSRNGSYQTTQFYNGFTSSAIDEDLAIGGLQDNSTVVYRGQDAWQRTLWGDGGCTGLFPENLNLLLGSSQYGRIYRSLNGGASWNWMNSEMHGFGDVVFEAPFVIAPSNHSILYAGRTNVWRSDNQGLSWSIPGGAGELDQNPVLSLSIYGGDPDVVWAATAPATARAGVHRTEDGARTWENVTGTLPDRYPVDIIAGTSGPDHAYVVFSGFGTSHLFRTSDGGGSWEDIGSGLPDIPSSALAFNNRIREHLYFGNDFGVWFSPDDGESWHPFTEGMPTGALIMDLSISYRDRTIRAVTHGLGVWERPLVAYEGTQPEPADEVVLKQNYPNPFNGRTLITYELTRSDYVRLYLYNTRGQLVKVLVEGVQPQGSNYVSLNSRGIPSGIYIYRLEVSGEVHSRRLMILK